ncbi:uncharacterized protein [Prorops nasuta]|uniref:uncharacterized protein n=1 Tax=Prorops nasuta TaxID=863751 RepID=UPI0034CE5759
MSDNASSDSSREAESTFSVSQSRILNKATEIQVELFHYTGLSCKKFTDSDIVFEFNCNNETFVIEIIKTKETWKIDKWVMPPSIDMKQLISQYALNEFTSLPTFIKHLKFHIECYKEHSTNFKKLQNFTENLSNFKCRTNIGLTQITLEFFQVYSMEEDLNIDINVHLIYKSKGSIPKEIQIESVLSKKLSDTTEKKTKIYNEDITNAELEENKNITTVSNSSKEDSNVNLQTRLKHKLTRRKKQKQGKRLKHLEKISNYDQDIKKNAYRQSNDKAVNNSLSKISVSPILNVSQFKQTKLSFTNN